MRTTKLSKSDTHSKSLKSTVPDDFVTELGLEKGSILLWEGAIIIDGEKIIVGSTEMEFIEAYKKEKGGKTPRIERAMLVRISKDNIGKKKQAKKKEPKAAQEG